jgi:hypothetical protein
VLHQMNLESLEVQMLLWKLHVSHFINSSLSVITEANLSDFKTNRSKSTTHTYDCNLGLGQF